MTSNGRRAAGKEMTSADREPIEEAEDVRVGPVSPGVPCDEAGHPGRAPSILRHPSPLRDGVSYLFHSSCRDSIVLRQLALSSISLVYTGEEPVRPPRE